MLWSEQGVPRVLLLDADLTMLSGVNSIVGRTMQVADYLWEAAAARELT
jgi:hypothetical protein